MITPVITKVVEHLKTLLPDLQQQVLNFTRTLTEQVITHPNSPKNTWLDQVTPVDTSEMQEILEECPAARTPLG